MKKISRLAVLIGSMLIAGNLAASCYYLEEDVAFNNQTQTSRDVFVIHCLGYAFCLDTLKYDLRRGNMHAVSTFPYIDMTITPKSGGWTINIVMVLQGITLTYNRTYSGWNSTVWDFTTSTSASEPVIGPALNMTMNGPIRWVSDKYKTLNFCKIEYR